MLAGVVITFNEEANIARCLQSLHFCDEIIVVDSGSSDRTVEIAKKFTEKVSILPWRGYAAQKNAANHLARAEWILSLDGDEVVSDSLRQEIQTVLALANAGRHAAYSLPRKTIHLGRWIRYGGWYPNRLVRLFDRTRGKWSEVEVHEKWESNGTVGELKNDLIHFSFQDLADQVNRNNQYSTLSAQHLFKSGARFSSSKLIFKSLTKFLETYFLKRGFLDGYPGFIISISAAYSVFLKWAKLWELQRSEKA